ncbi:hypothetical protein KVV02_000519 [Mortierella alpina]|uniref:SET domain-containing protein n=1 Tax=Mortierella alpina TaxID=64518 RepID=A0A9P8A7D1_MORAP|nr:hypothetical protein KVV02_000519 [Mortierella alpina]
MPTAQPTYTAKETSPSPVPTAPLPLAPPSSSSSSAPLQQFPSSSASTSTAAASPSYRFPANASTMDQHHPHWQHHQHYNDRSRKEPEHHYPHEPSDSHDHYYQQQQHHHHHHHQTTSYHTQQHSHPNGHSYPRGDPLYGRRGHRYSTDSAAADTLLMLSAAAFMDPAAARSVMAADADKRIGGHSFSSTASHDDHYSSYLGRPHGTSHYSSRYSPPPQEPRPHAMAKTVSAPASSLSAALHSLPPFSRLHHHQQQQHLDHVREMDIDLATPPPTSNNSRFKSESFQQTGSRHMDVDGATSRATNFASKTSFSPAASAALPAKSEPSSSSMHVDAEGPGRQHVLESHPSKNGAKDVKHEKEDPEEEEEEEDEVMSEGVVHVNARLAPIALSPQTKRRCPSSVPHPLPPLPPSISTSAANLPQSQQQDPPKTPTSARTPRTPKQTKAPKLPRTPRTAKRSQGDYQASSGSRGKNGTKDSLGDYFFSPFPPSSSPASSPSSLSSFHDQLQMLTCNFVSVQPHASPTGRFRRVPSSILTSTATPPVSPPASPGLDLLRDSPFHAGLRSATTSPTKASGSGSASVPPSPGLARSGAMTPQRSHFKPRWHTQPYMMFLALRAMPDRTAARQELIMAAVELDKKFSAEKGLPRVFTGKTPMNSASACLTNNGDKYFIPFKPEGSRSTHFRLAYQPVDFPTAVNEYNRWMDQLVQHDWPLCFGIPKEGALSATSMDDRQDIGAMKRSDSPPESKKRSADHEEAGQDLDLASGSSNNSNNSSSISSKKVKAENDSLQLSLQASSLESNSNCSRDDTRVADKMQRLDIQAANRFSGSPSYPSTPTRITTTTTAAAATTTAAAAATTATATATAMTSSMSQEEVARHNRKVGYRLEDLDTRHVPTQLSNIVRVGPSTVPNAGNGVFAVMDLPVGTPLGFYFGVPMTENEFDSLKDGVGMATQYSIMYHRTVLDATDESGQPYTDPQGVLYCPFHFMNEDPDGNVSFIAGSTVNQVICTTNREVKAGEELLVFYGKEMMDHHRPWAVPAATALAAGGGGQDGHHHVGEGGESRKSRAGSRSRASSPVKKATPSMTTAPATTTTTTTATTATTSTMMEEGGRPRRETVYKPARYTR